MSHSLTQNNDILIYLLNIESIYSNILMRKYIISFIPHIEKVLLVYSPEVILVIV